jgi:AcrR family transcriptional regulator
VTEVAPTTPAGRVLGERGVKTRQRILEVVAELIEQHGLRGLKLAEVAKRAGFSQPAFYQYFTDLDDAILALCKDVGSRLPSITFPDVAASENASSVPSTREFIVRFLAYWDEHRPVLWSRNLAITEGDPRFVEIRNQAFQPLMASLVSRIDVAKEAGLIDRSVAPMGLALPLVVMLDRIGMMSPKMVEGFGERADDVVDGLTYVFDRALGITGSS